MALRVVYSFEWKKKNRTLFFNFLTSKFNANSNALVILVWNRTKNAENQQIFVACLKYFREMKKQNVKNYLNYIYFFL